MENVVPNIKRPVQIIKIEELKMSFLNISVYVSTALDVSGTSFRKSPPGNRNRQKGAINHFYARKIFVEKTAIFRPSRRKLRLRIFLFSHGGTFRTAGSHKKSFPSSNKPAAFFVMRL